MRFYRIDYYVSDPTEQATEWATSQRIAEKIARENNCGGYTAKITPVEVPTNRKGLLAFLGEHIWTHPTSTAPYGGS